MKTPPKFRHAAASIALRLFATPAFLALPAATAATEAATANSAEKTHTLFLGADFSLEQHREFFQVEGVADGSFVIKVKNESVVVPVQKSPVNLKVNLAFKLTEKSALITGLKDERTYTPANDPDRKFATALADAEGLNATWQSSVNTTAAIKNEIDLKFAHYQPNPMDPLANSAVNQALQTSRDNYNAAVIAPGSNLLPVGSQTERDEAFDAISVSFAISAERPLSRPYVVIIARYHEGGAKPDATHNWIYARALEPISREPRKVTITQGGFPPGFELDGVQVHLYDNGEEIATNVAPKRVPLTREEAFQYVLLEYIGSHKGATLPATPAMGKLPADLPGRLAAGELNQAFYVKVSKDGKVTDAFLDESCSRKAEDPYLVSVVKNIRFKPALEKGKPIDGIAEVKLNQLAL